MTHCAVIFQLKIVYFKLIEVYVRCKQKAQNRIHQANIDQSIRVRIPFRHEKQVSCRYVLLPLKLNCDLSFKAHGFACLAHLGSER